MQFDVREVARILHVPESKVYHWIQDDSLPARLVNGKYALDRAELIEWATLKRLDIGPAAFAIGPGPTEGSNLADALERGGILRDITGIDKAQAMRQVVERMTLPPTCDRAMLLELFLSRETLGSTAVGSGIAIPHPRCPMVLGVSQPMVTLCLLSEPLEFGARDKRKVHTLFVMVCPTIRGHLQMLARISRALRDDSLVALIKQRCGDGDILDNIRRVERTIDAASAAAARD
jgi:PTS system nitrogen regulatory IIA component